MPLSCSAKTCDVPNHIYVFRCLRFVVSNPAFVGMANIWSAECASDSNPQYVKFVS